MNGNLKKLNNIWLLVLLSVFVLTVCFSIIRITFAVVDLAGSAETAVEEISASFSELASERDADLGDLLGGEGLRDILKWIEELEEF